jgi:hypothetical protein
MLHRSLTDGPRLGTSVATRKQGKPPRLQEHCLSPRAQRTALSAATCQRAPRSPRHAGRSVRRPLGPVPTSKRVRWVGCVEPPLAARGRVSWGQRGGAPPRTRIARGRQGSGKDGDAGRTPKPPAWSRRLCDRISSKCGWLRHRHAYEHAEEQRASANFGDEDGRDAHSDGEMPRTTSSIRQSRPSTRTAARWRSTSRASHQEVRAATPVCRTARQVWLSRCGALPIFGRCIAGDGRASRRLARRDRGRQ